MLPFLKTFEKYEITFIPRAQNHFANELAFAASNCQILHANEQYTIKVKNRPKIPDNIDYWQVFEGDKQIDEFLQSKNEFAIPKPSLGHEEDYIAEEQAHKTEMSFTADINFLEHPYEADSI